MTSSESSNSSSHSFATNPIETNPFDFLDESFFDETHAEMIDNYVENNDGTSHLVRGGLTSFHLDSIASRNWKAVLSWITFHSDEVATLVDREGHSSLHHVCLFRAPLDVIKAMIYAAPQLAMYGNDEGEIPLHWAVRVTLPLQVITTLLEANPMSGFVKDKNGVTPMMLLWDRHEEDWIHSFRSNGRESVVCSESWRRTMKLVEFFVNDSNIEKFPLHAIVQAPCESSFLNFALHLYSDEVNLPDECGNLPLHLACRSLITFDMLEGVLRANPLCASIPNAMGRLPLQIAVAAGKKWDEGVKLLFLANPNALGHLDPISHLYPFMEAAFEPKVPCLTTIYALLRASPEYVINTQFYH
jgi:hypothetical protein